MSQFSLSFSYTIFWKSIFFSFIFSVSDNDCNPVPSTTSPYYTLSNRSSHQYHQQLNGIAELPVSASAFTDPFASSNPSAIKAGVPIDSLQNGSGPSRNRFSYSNGSIIIPDVIDVSQQQDGSSLDFQSSHSNPHQQKLQYSSSYSGPPPYRNPPQTLPGGVAETSLTNGHTATTCQGPTSPQSVPDSPVDAYHTHSAKFPVSKQNGCKERENIYISLSACLRFTSFLRKKINVMCEYCVELTGN